MNYFYAHIEFTIDKNCYLMEAKKPQTLFTLFLTEFYGILFIIYVILIIIINFIVLVFWDHLVIYWNNFCSMVYQTLSTTSKIAK